MAKYLDKWKDLFPDTVGGTTRPSEAVSDQEEFNTDGFPQFIAQDPVNYALQNAFLKQFLSNDAWLWVKQKQANQALDDHKVDTQAHAKGISGNAGSATKLANARTINLSGAVTADAVSFDGTADATINVKTLDASKLKGTASVRTTGNAATATKLQTPRTLSLTGKAAGSTSFDGSSNAAINVTFVNADTASKLSTARRINITGNATGAATFDGTSDVSINVSVSQAAHADKATQDTNGNELANAQRYMHVYDLPNNTDFNNVKTTGIYTCTQDSYTNRPVGSWGVLRVYWFNNNVKQEYIPDNRYEVYERYFTPGATWNAWSKVNAANADTATKLATARTISLTGNASGSASFDGSGNVSINTNVNHSDRAAYLDNFSAPHFRKFDTTKDTWDIIGPNPGTWLTSIRTDVNAPNWLYGNFGAAIAFGGGDTKGAISVPYDGPWVKFAGGNGSKPVWYFSVGGSNGGAYNLDSFPTKTGGGASGTWGISISGNAASATNADKVDGYHASDLLRTLGGNRTPVITDIFDRAGTIDMTTMSAADKATHKANINKASNMTQNIWNNGRDIHAYGGDTNMNGYNRGTLKLTQSYKNFDKLMIVYTDDDGECGEVRMFDVYEFNYCMTNMHSFDIFTDHDRYWTIYGLTKHGNDSGFKPSTETVLSCRDQNSGLIGIYGIKF